MVASDPFSILGIPSTASLDEAHKAFRRLSKKFHPDIGGDPAKFEQIREAYESVKAGVPVKRVLIHSVSSPLSFQILNLRYSGTFSEPLRP